MTALSKFNRRQFYNLPAVDGVEVLDMLSLRWLKFQKTLRNRRVRIHVVRQFELGRLWAISNIYYDTDNLDWILALVNNITDMIGGMEIGQELVIPSMIDVEEFYNEIRANARRDQIATFSKVVV